jgi:hypothetical protein
MHTYVAAGAFLVGFGTVVASIFSLVVKVIFFPRSS